jgi:heat shock protein HtpX
VAYIVSHYIVLLLSRIREFYADQYSGNVTGDPDALSTALVKIAYGMAAAKDDEDSKDDARMIAGRAFGIFDPKIAQSLALVGAGEGMITADTMEQAMKWDLWNPWAGFYEFGSSHPLPAKRIQALEKQTESLGKMPHFSFRIVQPESYWDEFLVDLLVNFLPAVAFIFGIFLSLFIPSLGFTILLVFLAWWLKRWFSYRHEFDEKRDVKSLISEVKVSGVRSIPCTLEGKIIGRGVPGLFYSDDLVLQDDTGFIVVDYRQPLRFLEFLFGWIKAESLIGRTGKVMGWYRRSPKPYFEMRKLVFDDGETVTSYSYPVVQFLVYAGIVIGLFLILLA